MSTPTATYKMGGTTVTRPLLFISQLVAITPAADELIKASGIDPVELVQRHQAGDWGDVSSNVKAINNRGLSKGSMLMSTFRLVDIKQLAKTTAAKRSQLPTVLVITSAAMDARERLQRQSTTVLARGGDF